jgi:hypothetical protein
MQLQLSGDHFRQIVNAVAGSAAKGEISRPILSSINARITGKRIRLTAANGFVYSEIEVSGERLDENGADDATTYVANLEASKLKSVATGMNRRKDATMIIERIATSGEDAFWNVHASGAIYEIKTIGDTFPDLRETMKDVDPQLLFSCSAKLLRDLADGAIKGHGSTDNNLIHVFQLNPIKGNLSPLVIRYDDDERSPETNPEPMIARSILMPMMPYIESWGREYIDPCWPHPGPGFGKRCDDEDDEPSPITG